MTTHTIGPGETLSGIARRYGTSVAELQRLNGIADPNMIRAGSALVVKTPAAPAVAPAAAKAGTAATAKSSPTTLFGSVVASCPASAARNAPRWRAAGDDHASVLYADARGDSKAEGLLGSASGEISAGAVKMDHAGYLGNPYVGGSHKMELWTAEAKAAGGVVHGAGGTASAKATWHSGEGTLFVGTDQNNPWAEGGGAYSLLQAEAKVDALVGSDGRRAGLAVGGQAMATTAAGDLKGEISIPIPFTDWTISLRGKGGGSVGSVGAAGEAHAYKDLQTSRYHAGMGGEAAALVGIKADFDLSVGPRYANRERTVGP